MSSELPIENKNLRVGDEAAMAGVSLKLLAISLALSLSASSQTMQGCRRGVKGQ